MDSLHRKFVPSVYHDHIVCALDYTYNEELIILICVKHGELIELHIDTEHNTVIETISLSIETSNIKHIKLFFALNQTENIFYLVHTHSNELLVIQKLTDKLKLKEKMYKVEKVCITDANNSGRAQVSIWFNKSDVASLVTDFSDELSEHSQLDGSSDKLANALRIQLELLNNKIAKRIALREEKIKLRNQMFEKTTENKDITELEDGLGSSSDKEIQTGLKINKIVQKMFSTQWFILLELENQTCTPVIDISFVLNFNPKFKLTYKTFMIDFDTPKICIRKSVKHKCLAVIMFDVPEFTSDKIVIEGALYSKTGSSDEPENIAVLPSIELSIHSLLDNKGSCLCSGTKSMYDIYCVMLVSRDKSFQLNDEEKFLSIFGLSRLDVNNSDESFSFYHTSDPAIFNGVLFSIHHSEEKAILHVYVTCDNQLRCIELLGRDLLGKHHKTDHSIDLQSDLNHCVALLRNEIVYDTMLSKDNPKQFFSVNKKHIFEIQSVLSKYKTSD